MNSRSLINEKDIKNISKVSFNIWTADEIKAASVALINDTKLEGESSVYDPRMGSDGKSRCKTCDETTDCPGHFGHIELDVPILHPSFLKQIRDYLTVFCSSCFKLLCTKTQLKLLGINKYGKNSRFDKILEFVENSVSSCPHCDNIVPKHILMENKIFCYYGKSKDKKIELTTPEIENIFGKINPRELKVLELSHRPIDLILTILPVLPICCRPPVKSERGTFDDDLTHKYVDIIKVNKKLMEFSKSTKPVSENKRQQFIQNLEFHIQTMFDNSRGKAKQILSKKPIKCIKQRLSGKQGLFRHNLQGKRVDFSARTVFNIDPNLSIDEVGLPEEWRTHLTYPEYVNSKNKKELEDIVNGNNPKIGANVIIRNGQRISIKHLSRDNSKENEPTELLYKDKVIRNGKRFYPEEYEMMKGKKFELKEGDKIFRNYKVIEVKLPKKRYIKLQENDIVERHLKDGDFVVDNRQPSLHKFSFGGGKIVFLPGKSFRLNEANCGAKNADCDGDELNIHIPQTELAKAEVQELIGVKNNLIGGKDSGTMLTICQDAVTGGYRMTKGVVPIDREDFYQLLLQLELGSESVSQFEYIENKLDHIERVYRDKFKGEESKVLKYKYSGYGLMSVLLPDDLSVSYNNDMMVNGKKESFVIEKGVILSGCIDKNVVGKSKNSLIQVLCNNYSNSDAVIFGTNYQKLVHQYLLLTGFSIGIQDCFTQNDLRFNKIEGETIIEKTLHKTCEDAKVLYSTEKDQELLERKINILLNNVNTIGEKFARESLTPDNAFKDMIVSKAKGQYVNIAQILAGVGQQNVDGARIPKTFKSRTLPHFKKSKLDFLDPFTDNPELELKRLFISRGFVESSFIKGLTPVEMFFHAMGGRIGVIDTGIKTSTTGYISRKLVKKLENVKTSYIGTVVNAKNNILTFDYNDGFDPTRTIIVGKNKVPQFCNVEILAEKLNNFYENELSLKKSKEEKKESKKDLKKEKEEKKKDLKEKKEEKKKEPKKDFKKEKEESKKDFKKEKKEEKKEEKKKESKKEKKKPNKNK